MKQNLIRRSAILAALVLVIVPSPAPEASPVYVITDPMRDGNWWLKQAREAILQAERLTLYAVKQAKDYAITMKTSLNNESNSSMMIQGSTTAVSMTENAESEERYSIDDAKGLVCDVVGLVNSFSPSLFCQSELISQASDYGMINNALGGDQFAAHKKFFEQIQNESVHSSQSDADKQFVETLTLQIENTGKILGDYTLISEEEYGQTMATVDAIFGTRISGPDAEDIQRLKLPSGPHQLDGLRKSLLYRAYIEDNLNRRTIRNGAAIDGSVIDQGSMDAYHKRVETLNGVTHSDVAKRLNALYTAKLLESSFVSLRKSLQKQTINALKYKELRGR